MKVRNYFMMAMLVSMSMLTVSCGDDDDDSGDDPVTPSVSTELSGTLTENTTLEANTAYTLKGELIVPEGITLTINAGVTITAVYDDQVDYILVKQGGKINAVGTASSPIVMTSSQKQPGAWGGIHICGSAPINAEGGSGNSEIGNATYGGSVANDNSGRLSYVRVEYTGYAFDEEHEANGITFYGVGSGTTVDHCEAYKGSDDGFEFFGGTVNVSEMVVVSCSDDSFDWTEGWCGTATNLVAYQEAAATLGYDCDCLIEADNNENNYSASPVSHPTLSNVILVGNNSSENSRGVRLRRGTQVTISNMKVCGKSRPLTLESEETEKALADGTSSIINTTLAAALNSQNSIFTNDNFLAATGNSVDEALSLSIADATWITGSWVKQ